MRLGLVVTGSDKHASLLCYRAKKVLCDRPHASLFFDFEQLLKFYFFKAGRGEDLGSAESALLADQHSVVGGVRDFAQLAQLDGGAETIRQMTLHLIYIIVHLSMFVY